MDSANGRYGRRRGTDHAPVSLSTVSQWRSGSARGSAERVTCRESPSKITLCSNSNSSSSDFKVALKHELIHAYDLSNKRYDFDDCQGLAHTEIRAAREADCNRYFLFDFMKKACIIDKASASTNSIFKGRGRECVKEVYDSAMKDNEPFIQIRAKDK